MITNWSREISNAVRELRGYLDRRLIQLFSYTMTAKASAIGDSDAVESSDESNDQPPGSPVPKGEKAPVRVQPFGFNGVPPAKLRGLVLRLGTSNLFFIGIGPQQKYGPQSLNTGEVAVFNAFGAQIVLLNDGSIQVTPHGAGTAQLGGATYNAPKWNTFETDMQAFVNIVLGGTVGMTGQFTPAQVTTMTAFANAIGAGTYNSTKASNG
jgi:phage gp45-like